MKAVHPLDHSVASDPLQVTFLAALPRLVRVARFRFRRVPCPDIREDCICETIALCWLWFVRLASKGRDPTVFMTALANYGASAVNSGRRLCGQQKSSDILSRRFQRSFEFSVMPLPQTENMTGDGIEHALRDNTQTPIPDQVQFRCDFPAWKQHLTVVKRRLIDRLILGHRTKDLAQEFSLSVGRISQLRKEFYTDYQLFCGSLAER
jgi:hypothetical protein